MEIDSRYDEMDKKSKAKQIMAEKLSTKKSNHDGSVSATRGPANKDSRNSLILDGFFGTGRCRQMHAAVDKKGLPGDVILLCSDGLSDMVDDNSIKDVLLLKVNLPQKVEELIQLAKGAGGHDNITVILCEFAR